VSQILQHAASKDLNATDKERVFESGLGNFDVRYRQVHDTRLGCDAD